jgi:hypothetical protein
MIPERYRPLEIHTLMDLVSYGDPHFEEPGTEDWLDGEEEAAPRRSVLGRGWRPWSSVRSRGKTWLRLGRRLIARSRVR